MKTNETSQATYTVEKSTILNVHHENGMRTQYELDEDKGCLQLKSVYMMDESQSDVELPAFIIFEDVNYPVSSIAACVLTDMRELFGHRRVDRQYHIRQEIVYHTEYDGARSADHFNAPYPYRFEQGIKQTAVIEQRHQRIRPYKQAYPHRQHQKQNEHPLRRRL